MTLDVLITDATIVNSTHTVRGHIGITDRRITAIYDGGTTPEDLPPAKRVVEAAGRTVIPGGVDAHCHIEQVTGAYKSLDTFEIATTAALWGGTTTVIDFGIPANSTETPLEAAENKMSLMRTARCDVALHGSVISWDETVPKQLKQLAEYGIRSVKMYTTNRGSTMANGDTIVKVMKEMVGLDGLTFIHAEHDSIVVHCTEEHARQKDMGIEHLHRTRPELAETASVRETLAMAEYAEAPVYFVHQTVAEAVELVHDARARGMTAYSETCPHYLTLDESVYSGELPERFACCPPMRTREAVEGLVKRTLLGDVDVIASDHSSYNLNQKSSRRDDIRFMPHGLPGVETRMPVAYTVLVQERGMTLQQFVQLFSTAPAQINGLDKKGVIAPGYDADLVIFDPQEVRVVDGKALHMGTDFSPFDSMELTGWPSTVIAGGSVVLDDGVFTDPGPRGRFIKRLGVREMRENTQEGNK